LGKYYGFRKRLPPVSAFFR